MSADKRFKPRMSRRIAVDFFAQFIWNNEFRDGRVKELSDGGMLVEVPAAKALVKDDATKFSVFYHENDKPMEVSGKILYHHNEGRPEGIVGMGIQFIAPSMDVKRKLQIIIKDPSYNTMFFRRSLKKPDEK